MKTDRKAAVLSLKATTGHVTECAGKTNIRLEVKWSDCAPGEIPELPANTPEKINAERCCPAAEDRRRLLAAPLLFFSGAS